MQLVEYGSVRYLDQTVTSLYLEDQDFRRVLAEAKL